MAKFRCCRLHELFVFLLLMCAFSLVNHYFMDVIGFDDATECQEQYSTDNCKTNPNAIHRADLHGGFKLEAIYNFSFQPNLWFRVDIDQSFGLAWNPPTLVRPPIFN